MVWIDELIGLTTWGAKIGIGTHLTLELGEKYLTDRNRPHGKWHVWAAGVPWRIMLGRSLIVDSGCRNLDIEKVKILNGKVLQSVFFEKCGSHIIFKFSGEVMLEVFIDTPGDGSELVIMSKKDSYFLNGNGKIGHE